MNASLLYLLTMLAGAGVGVQAGINSQLHVTWAKNPIFAAFASFLVGTLGLFIYLLAARVPWPPMPVKIVPWHWTGGLLGAFLC